MTSCSWASYPTCDIQRRVTRHGVSFSNGAFLMRVLESVASTFKNMRTNSAMDPTQCTRTPVDIAVNYVIARRFLAYFIVLSYSNAAEVYT